MQKCKSKTVTKIKITFEKGIDSIIDYPHLDMYAVTKVIGGGVVIIFIGSGGKWRTPFSRRIENSRRPSGVKTARTKKCLSKIA